MQRCCKEKLYSGQNKLKLIEVSLKDMITWRNQPCPRAFSLFNMADWRYPWPRLPKWLHKFVRISLGKHDEMSSFCLNNGFRLQKTIRAARHWKQPPKKHNFYFHHESHDKILHNSWSISASLARGFSDPTFWVRRRHWGWGCKGTISHRYWHGNKQECLFMVKKSQNIISIMVLKNN